MPACLGKADKAKKKPPVAKTEESAHGRIATRVAVVVEAKDLAKHHEFAASKPSGASTRATGSPTAKLKRAG